MNVAAALMRTLRAAGVRYLFGNPGTTELPFLDALDGSGLEYVVALQEATAVAAADGWAQASGEPGVVNLHVAPGLANGLSILHNAARARSPVVVTAGQQDTRLLLGDPILAGDLVQLSEQFTKWSHEVRRADDAVPALRRALTLARTAPTGPVFLSLPMDLLVEDTVDPGDTPVVTPAPAVADPVVLARAAEILARASAPTIVAGDGVARAGAVPALVQLAETLGTAVHGEPIYRRVNFPGDHPLWRGGLHPTVAGVRKALEGADAVFLVGASAFTWFLHTPGTPLRPGVAVVQIGDEADEIGKRYPVTLGIVGDPRDAVTGITRALAGRMTEAARQAAADRAARIGAGRAEHARRLLAAAEAEAARTPVAAAHLVHVLAGLLPRGAVVVDESASSLPHVLRHLPLAAPGSFFGSKTGTLGWAMGAAIGIQLATPERKVVVTIGDGSVMYAPQALWTAARYRLPITYVVANNASYAILKSGMETLGLASAKRGVFPGMDLVDPEIDYLGLSRALGVRARRVDQPGDVRDALAEAIAHDGPALVDVAIERGFGRLA